MYFHGAYMHRAGAQGFGSPNFMAQSIRQEQGPQETSKLHGIDVFKSDTKHKTAILRQGKDRIFHAFTAYVPGGDHKALLYLLDDDKV